MYEILRIEAIALNISRRIKMNGQSVLREKMRGKYRERNTLY